MKRSIALGFILSLLMVAMAYAQSACPPGHEELCRPPSSRGNSSGNNGSNPGRNTRPEDSGPSRSDRAQAEVQTGYTYMNRWHHSGSTADYDAAKAAFERALSIEEHYGPALVGIVDLYSRLDRKNLHSADHLTIMHLAQEGAKYGKVSHEFNSKVHAFFNLTAEREYAFYLAAWYDEHCQLSTSSSGSGAVDLSGSLHATLQQCAKVRNDMVKESAKADADTLKYNKKYN